MYLINDVFYLTCDSQKARINTQLLFNWLMIIKPSYSTHWGRVTYIGVGNLTIFASDNGLSPTHTWTNAGILLIVPLGTYFNEIVIKRHIFSSKKMYLKTSSGKQRPFCLELNVFKSWIWAQYKIIAVCAMSRPSRAGGRLSGDFYIT